MYHVSVRKPVGTTGLAVATACAIALAPLGTQAANHLSLPKLSAPIISTQAVQLTDAWSQLITATEDNLGEVVTLSSSGLPAVSNPVAPIAEQAAINLLIYGGQLVSGQGGQIPGEILSHFGKIVALVQQIAPQIPTLLVTMAETQLAAVTNAVKTFVSNPLTGVFEAPAAFLNGEINGTAGLLVLIQTAIAVRNDVASALDPPLPKWLSWLKPAQTTPSNSAPISLSISAASKTKDTKPISLKFTGPFAAAGTGPAVPTRLRRKPSAGNGSAGASTKSDGHPSTAHTTAATDHGVQR